MVNVRSRKCAHRGCTKEPRFGVAGTKTAEFCSGHAKDGMVNVCHKKCTHRGCPKQPKFGVAGTKTAEFCSGHAEGGMVNVRSRKCAHRGCTKEPRFGVAGTKTAEFCSPHAEDGMVNVCSKKCAHRGCPKRPSFGVAGTKTAESCSGHAKDGMVYLRASKNLPGVLGTSSGTLERGGVGVDGGTDRLENWEGRSPFPRTGTSVGNSRVGNKRTCQAPVQPAVPSTPNKTAVDQSYIPTGGGSLSEPDDAVVKTEVAVPSKAAPTGAFPVEAVVGERATPVEYASCAEPDDAVKTEVIVSFPSKRTADGVKLNRRGGKRPMREVRGSASSVGMESPL
ncbi:unnamed protein product, partial [Pylaiella littoralis]